MLRPAARRLRVPRRRGHAAEALCPVFGRKGGAVLAEETVFSGCAYTRIQSPEVPVEGDDAYKITPKVRVVTDW